MSSDEGGVEGGQGAGPPRTDPNDGVQPYGSCLLSRTMYSNMHVSRSLFNSKVQSTRENTVGWAASYYYSTDTTT
eukprot:COSAG01_NODE_3237_length_6370_cov_4.236007_4_plen_75_part_00